MHDTSDTDGAPLTPALPPFEIVGRRRPVDLVSPGSRQRLTEASGGVVAPYVAVEAALTGSPEPVRIHLTSGDTELTVDLDEDRVALEVTAAGVRTRHQSRRFSRATAPEALAATLTGLHLTAFTREAGQWRARGRVDLTDRIDTHDEAWLAGVRLGTSGPVGEVAHGDFGQLGLRDVRLVTEADGAPVRDGDAVWLSATSAGPGFFDTAHTSMWRLTPHTGELTHTGDLFFRRPDRPGVFGDHATHVVRDGGRWLVATSTWGDFVQPASRAARRTPSTLRATLATTATDPRTGRHVLDTEELELPVGDLTSVGVWDPHLVRRDGTWWVGYVSAQRFFRFHPVLASGSSLDALVLRGAQPQRQATEGTTLLAHDGSLVVLASDGRDGRRGEREAYPVFDTDLAQIGSLRAPYPSNIPWPTLLPPATAGEPWHLIAFNGRSHDASLLGYGTHGDIVLMRSTAPHQ